MFPMHSNPLNRPFDDFTIDEVYDFHKQYTRPADDSTTIEPFTYFTFLCIDDECVDPVDPNAGFSLMVCSDAPDYDDADGETTLKKMRLPIQTAIWSLIPLEELTITPSEALNPNGDALCSIPAPTHKQVSKPPDEMFTVASFAEARMFKREAILHREVALKPSYAERMIDDERRTQLFRCAMKEAKVTAHLYREVEELSRRRGTTFRVKPNTKRSRSEEREGANDGDEGEESENDEEEESVLNHKRLRSKDEEDEGLEEPDAERTEEKRARRECVDGDLGKGELANLTSTPDHCRIEDSAHTTSEIRVDLGHTPGGRVGHMGNMPSSNDHMEEVRQPSAVMNLPLELRNKIYRELLVPEKMRNPNDPIPRYDLQPAILRVNRQTHKEASRILYRENTWVLFEIHSQRLFRELGVPSCDRTFTADLANFPDLPALEVGIRGPEEDDVDEQILVGRCDLHSFFSGVVTLALETSIDYGWASLDFDLHFCGRSRVEEESLVDFFQDVRGARSVSVNNTVLLSTGRELATLMMKPITNINEINERASVYQARGDKYFASRRFQEAMETYDHGFKYIESLDYLRSFQSSFGGLQGDIPVGVQRFHYKKLSLWFARVLCSLQLRIPMFEVAGDIYYTSLYRHLAITKDSFAEANNLLNRGEPWKGLEMFLSLLRKCPMDQRVDGEIDHMEAQLRTIVPETAS